MNIITVTSDWSECDYYLPRLTGELYSVLPEAKVVNITHTVHAFNIPEACFLLKNSYGSFPSGTIHLIAVNSEPAPDRPMVLVKYNGHWFVFPDDGRFALLLEPDRFPAPAEVYRLPLPDKPSTFSACGLFVKAADLIAGQKIVSGAEPHRLKLAGCDIPSVTGDRIVGRVVYIDSYGNAITNISREIFARGYINWKANVEHDPGFVIYVQGPYLKICNIYTDYNQVHSGGTVALFNSAGLLELAINNGNFAKVENIDTTAEITIKFT